MYTRLRAARKADAGAIAALVNRAYRPDTPERGWTHESDLVSGDRISPLQVLALFRPRSAVLVLESNGCIIACAHVEMIDDDAWIGMLAIEPRLQVNGLGKRMLHDAEQYAMERYQAKMFRMSVISQRPALRTARLHALRRSSTLSDR